MKEIAFVTDKKAPHLQEGDQLLGPVFEAHGYTWDAIPWEQKGIPWDDYEGIILRSCWNYHYHIEEFTQWLDELKQKNANLWNPVSLVTWNIQKNYLLDLLRKDIPIVPTIIVQKESTTDLQEYTDMMVSDEVVVKPAVGASAYGVFRSSKKDAHKKQKDFQKLLRNSDVLIQPLMEEVMTEGEYSMVILGGKYSHAVLKTPKKGEFRVHMQYGGGEKLCHPPVSVISQAEHIVSSLDTKTLYARVDGIIQDKKLILMELEVCEPYLCFEYDPPSAERFVRAFMELTR